MKKVRYALGIAGVTPAALGLVMPNASAATNAHTQKKVTKTVSLRGLPGVTPLSCTGHTEHTATHSGLHLTFWSTKNGSYTCIGTIKVQGGGTPEAVWISRNGTEHCYHSGLAGVSDIYSAGCHQSFKRTFSVVGWGSGRAVNYKV